MIIDKNKKDLLKYFKEDFSLKHDPWGLTMDWFFTVAHILYFKNHLAIPKEWEYSPGAFFSGDIDDEEYLLINLYDLLAYSTEDLVFMGNKMDKISKELRKRGLDY